MLPKKTAVVIEDDEDISFLLNFLLQKDGYEVRVAKDGRKAMEMIETEVAPQVVLLDIMLPFYDGFALLKVLRSKPDWKDVPVLMLTAKSRGDDIDRAMLEGADDFIVKPFQPIELLSRIEQLYTTKCAKIS